MIRRREFLGAGLAPFFKNGRTSRECIVLRLTGGASQLDTWDMKPDAPSGIRGPYRPIRTNVPGIEISEIFPRMARLAERYAIIRSVHHEVNTHEAAWDVVLPAELAGCVTVLNLFDEFAWDVHGWKPFDAMECYRDVMGPRFDAAYSSLLEDLSWRGLLENTLVVATGEFGRTPKINPDGGRDHWPGCFSILMAGGGIRGGQVYGSSDRIGAEPRDRPVTPGMIAATIRTAMGMGVASDGVPPLTELFG